MVDFVNIIELSDQKYQTNGNVRDENYKVRFLFTMMEFVSFRIDILLMYFMSTKLLKNKINGVRVAQIQLYYIHDTTNTSQKNCSSCVVKYIVCGGEIKMSNYRSGNIA